MDEELLLIAHEYSTVRIVAEHSSWQQQPQTIALCTQYTVFLSLPYNDTSIVRRFLLNTTTLVMISGDNFFWPHIIK